jgi:hypothetical protein
MAPVPIKESFVDFDKFGILKKSGPRYRSPGEARE